MQTIIVIFAALFTYRGTVVLPHDPATGLVGISHTNGAVYGSTTIKMPNPPVLEPGQIVSVLEDIRKTGRRTDRFITNVQIVGKRLPPTFTPVTAKALNGGKAVGQLAFRDARLDLRGQNAVDVIFCHDLSPFPCLAAAEPRPRARDADAT